jgi:hypothetical protein
MDVNKPLVEFAKTLPIEKKYEVSPLHGQKLTPREQEFLSSFVIGDATILERAMKFGLNIEGLKVEFTFMGRHERKGGLLFRRL